MAFSTLMERRNDLLTVESASKYFSYLNQLDGLNKTFIQNLSNIQFIPLAGLFSIRSYFIQTLSFKGQRVILNHRKYLFVRRQMKIL